MRDGYTLKSKKEKTLFRRKLAWTIEILVVVLAVLARSRIARFLSTKITLDLVVEVTDKLGPEAGHRLSTVIAAIVAEPLIVAYIVAGIFVVVNILAVLFRSIRAGRRKY